jgi:hypothetical protein
MKRTLALGTVSLAASALLVGCGSSSSSDNTDALTGYFIDSAVKGVDYNSTSGLHGTTDKFGRFQYKNGDKVRLYIGNLLLGEVAPTEEGLVTPKTLTAGDEAKETLLLRTLQTLDADGNTSNGITIPQTVVDDLKDINETSIHEHNESSLIDLIDSGDKHALDSDYDGHIDVKDSDAKEHFDNSQTEWNEGKRPDRGHEGEPVGETNSGESHGNGNGGKDNENSQDNNSSEESHGDGFDLSKYPLSTLTPELKNTLSHMGNEERLAYDVYQNLYTYHVEESDEEIKQFKNISEKSEVTHVGIVQDLVQRYALNPEDVTNVKNPVKDRDVSFEDMPSGEYDIPAIQSLYDTLYAKGIVSKTEALMVGCMVEVTDVNDLDKYITMAETSKATDIVDAFNVLRKGSYNHYWAFDKGLKKSGVTNGCFVEGDTLLTNKEGVYPTNDHESEEGEGSTEESHGNGNGNGNGQGRGRK